MNKLLTNARNKIVKIFEEQDLFVSLKPFFTRRVHYRFKLRAKLEKAVISSLANGRH